MLSWARLKLVKVNSPEEFQKVLNIVKRQCINVYFRKRESGEDIKQDCFIEETLTKIKITFKPALKAKTFIFDKDEEYQIQCNPKDAVSAMSRSFKIQRTKKIMNISPKHIESALPLLYKNKKYDGKAVYAYEYDLKEAYGQMLKLPLPDLYTYRSDAKINKGEVGFYAVGEHLKCTFEEGKVCQYVFKLMESPYIRWVNRIEKLVSKATTKEQKLELKSRYRFAIGDLQNLNPFWRCIIVERCNQLVKSYMDENTVYCNTDSIVSTVRRLDIENDKEFTWSLKRSYQLFKWQKGKMNYQWNDEIPCYKGPSKRYIEWYNKTHDIPWNILTDSVPKVMSTLWLLNKEELKLVKNYEKD